MANKDTAINNLCKSLGSEYKVCTIDLERVIYRDFGNGFNVEISGVHTTSAKRKATLYLWFGEKQGECCIIKTVREVPQIMIPAVVDMLRNHSFELIADGVVTWDKLFQKK